MFVTVVMEIQLLMISLLIVIPLKLFRKRCKIVWDIQYSYVCTYLILMQLFWLNSWCKPNWKFLSNSWRPFMVSMIASSFLLWCADVIIWGICIETRLKQFVVCIFHFTSVYSSWFMYHLFCLENLTSKNAWITLKKLNEGNICVQYL